MIRQNDGRGGAPVFVIGCPRSGTTLLYHMLLSAGDFAVYRTETHVFNTLVPRFGNLSRAENRDALLALWIESDGFVLSGLDAEDVRRRVEQGCRNGGDFLRIVMEAIAELQGVSRWAETTPAHLLHMREIKETIPDALFVHVIRDGRDVAVSMDKQEWVRPLPWDRKSTVLAAGAFWSWMVDRGRRSGHVLGAAYLEVRYEDLVEKPQDTLDVIGNFIAKRLDYHEIQRNGIGSVARPNTSFPGEVKSFVGRWRSAITPAQGNELEALLAPRLRELAYELSPAAAAGGALAALRQAPYDALFGLRHALKVHTPLGRTLSNVGFFMPGFTLGSRRRDLEANPSKTAPDAR